VQVNYQEYEWYGQPVVIPFRVIGEKSVIGKDGKVSNVKQINEGIKAAADREDFPKLIDMLEDQYFKTLRMVTGIPVKGHYGPVFTSADIAPEYYFTTPEGGTVVNEDLMTSRAVDSDGDHALRSNLKDANGKYFKHREAMFIKFPFTKKVPVLKELPGKYPYTTFTPVPEDKEIVITDMSEKYNLDALVEKAKDVLAMPLVGPTDNYFDYKEAMAVKDLDSYHMKVQHLFEDEDRFLAMEGDMKKVRGGKMEKVEIPRRRSIGTLPTCWILGMARGKSYSLLPEIKDAIYMMRYLEGMEFETVESALSRRDDEVFPIPKKLEINSKGHGIVQRLIDLKLLTIEKIPHAVPGLFVSVIRLYTPSKDYRTLHPVAVTETKRDTSVMTYCIVVSPIVVNYDNQVKIVPIEYALEAHLNSVMTFMPLSGGHWPSRLDHIHQNPVKSAMLEKALREFLSKYGYFLYHNKTMKTMALAVAKNKIAVHFQTKNPHEKAAFMKELNIKLKATKLAIVPCGGNKKGTERANFSICDPVTFSPLYAGKYADPKRSCQIASQLANAVPLPRKACLVITGRPEDGKGTGGQMFMTSEGAELSKLSNVFLNSLVYQKDENHQQRTTFRNFAGEEFEGWLGDPQATSEIPKILSPIGLKNMAMRIYNKIQVQHNGFWFEPDFLLSLKEIEDKDAWNSLVEHGVERSFMNNNGEIIPCFIVFINLYRSTNASECVKPGKKTRVVSGMEAHAIKEVLLNHNLEIPESEPDMEYLEAIRKAVAQIRDICNLPLPNVPDGLCAVRGAAVGSAEGAVPL